MFSIGKVTAYWLLCVAYCGTCDAANSILYFTSSKTSWVGQNGRTFSLSADNGYTILGQRYRTGNPVDPPQNGLGFAVNKDGVFAGIGISFIGANNSLPVVGAYLDAKRYPFQGNNSGLSLITPGRGDNTLTGQFQVLEATYESYTGQLLTFAADFIQYDEGVSTNWVQGSIRFNSDIPITPVPEPSTLALLCLGGLGLLMRRRR